MTRQMKTSGVEWIGDIPEKWQILRLKNTVEHINEKTESIAQNYIGLENIESWTGHYINQSSGIPEGVSNIFRKNDILFSKLRPYLAKCLMADFSGICSSELLVLRNFKGYSRFLFHLLLSHGFINIVDSSTYGSKMPRANYSFIGNVEIPYPPLSEQKAIADYLDAKCAKIDDFIAKQKTVIEKLKEYKQSVITEAVTKGLNPAAPMKASGVEWIGEIPEDWNINKIKRFLRYVSTKDKGNCEVLSLYRELGIVPKNSRNDNHNVTAEDTSNYRFVRKGDFVINKMKAWQGSVAVSDFDGIVSPAYFVYEFISNVFVKKYFHYLLRNKQYAKEFERLSGGIRIGQWDLPAIEFENTVCLVPSLPEQKEIADYLDKKCAEIDTLIEKKQKFLTELATYKKSMIYEYVTGKKEVA